MISTNKPPPTNPNPNPVPDYLIRQLQTIRATINHLTRLQPNNPSPTTAIDYCIWGWDNLPRTVLMYYANFISSPEGYFHTVLCNKNEFRNTTVNSDDVTDDIFDRSWVYIDDVTDDIFEGVVSESSDDSDVEWGCMKKKKSKRMKRGNRSGFKTRPQVVAANEKNARNGSDKSVQQGTPTVPATETSEKVVGVNTRRKSGQGAKEMGKLDLNVEFNNNEGEESSARVTSGNRVNGEEDDEDNIEGIGFFEGLDEFFSSLPILSVGKDEKVKAG